MEKKEFERKIVGFSMEDALVIAEFHNYKIRAVKIDGKHQSIRESCVPSRLNVGIENGKIVETTNWQ